MTDKLRAMLEEAVLQLEYLNEKEQRGTTNAVITRARAALAAAPQPMGCGYPCGFDCNGACFDAAAPQPALKDREALMEVIQQALWCCPDTGQMPDDAIADALLARGLRLPGDDALQQLADLGQQADRASETMAWAKLKPEGEPNEGV